MLSQYVTILEKFTDQMWVTLSLTVELAKVKCKYGNRMQKCDFLFVANYNVFPISHPLRDSHSRNVHALVLTFRMGQGRIKIRQSKGQIRLSICWQ